MTNTGRTRYALDIPEPSYPPPRAEAPMFGHALKRKGPKRSCNTCYGRGTVVRCRTAHATRTGRPAPILGRIDGPRYSGLGNPNVVKETIDCACTFRAPPPPPRTR